MAKYISHFSLFFFIFLLFGSFLISHSHFSFSFSFRCIVNNSTPTHPLISVNHRISPFCRVEIVLNVIKTLVTLEFDMEMMLQLLDQYVHVHVLILIFVCMCYASIDALIFFSHLAKVGLDTVTMLNSTATNDILSTTAVVGLITEVQGIRIICFRRHHSSSFIITFSFFFFFIRHHHHLLLPRL